MPAYQRTEVESMHEWLNPLNFLIAAPYSERGVQAFAWIKRRPRSLVQPSEDMCVLMLRFPEF